jgi:hypothetical protein
MPSGPAVAVTVGDLNDDGKADMASRRWGTEISVRLNNGNGTFGAQPI